MSKLFTTILGSALLAAVTTAAASEANERALRQAMAYSQRGMRALEKGNGSRAAEDFKRALEQVPELPDAHAGLGHVAMQQRRFDDALVAYRRAREAYRRFAARLAPIFRRHGALEVRECALDASDPACGLPFPKAVRARPGETIVFAWVTYKSKADRDRVNTKFVSDPELASTKNLPFDPKRSVYGGFRVIVAK